jgi:hypothetical protein
MAILNKRISSATLPEVQQDARLGSIIRDVASAPATENAMYRTINPSASTNQTALPAYVSQLTSAKNQPQSQNYTSMVAPTRSNDVSLMSSQMPDMSGMPNISKGPITSITSPGDTARQKIGSTTSTSGGVPSAVINALAGAVMGLGAQKIINKGSTTSNPASGTQKPPVTSTVSTLPKWAQGNPTITDNKNGTYTQKTDDGSTLLLDKDGKVIKTTDENGDIYIDGEYHHDNGDGTFNITSKDGTVRVVNDLGTVIDLKPAEDKTETSVDPVKAVEESIIDSPHPFFPESDIPEGKSGGLAVMMKNGGVAHFDDGGPAWAKGLMNIKDNGNGTYTQTMDDGSTVMLDKNGAPIGSTDKTPDPTIDPVQSILDLLKTSGGAAGAGGLLAALLSSTGGSQSTQNTGLDMSTYGLLNPRTTNFGMGPARYVSHKDYSPQSTYTPNAELLHNLNAPASNPVNEGDYKDPYITNRPGTNNGMTGGTDINAIIAQIVNAIKNQKLASQVNQASAVPTGSAVASSSAASTPTGGGFVIGGDGTSKADYDRAVAQKKAQDAADAAKLAAFQYDPNSTLGKLITNPSSIPHLYGETDAQAADRIKTQLMGQTQSTNDRANEAKNFAGSEFVVTNPGQPSYGYGTPQTVDPAEYSRLLAAHDAEVAKSMGSGLFTTGGGSPAPSPTPTPSGPSQADLLASHDAEVAASMANSPFTTGGRKMGGAIHKATGGLTHYTYGKPADVMENLGLREQHMAQGGLPQMSNVPLVQGRMDFRQGSAVHGEGDGQSDDIPAMLADGEYVIDAETVAQIGNGSTKAGAQALDKFRESIRAHKRSAPINKIPPKTKALTSYLKVK